VLGQQQQATAVLGWVAALTWQHAGKFDVLNVCPRLQWLTLLSVLSLLGCPQVFDFWPQSLSGLARKQRAGLGLLVGRWGTPLPRKVRVVVG
jgi:hypothetical protein